MSSGRPGGGASTPSTGKEARFARLAAVGWRTPRRPPRTPPRARDDQAPYSSSTLRFQEYTVRHRQSSMRMTIGGMKPSGIIES